MSPPPFSSGPTALLSHPGQEGKEQAWKDSGWVGAQGGEGTQGGSWDLAKAKRTGEREQQQEGGVAAGRLMAVMLREQMHELRVGASELPSRDGWGQRKGSEDQQGRGLPPSQLGGWGRGKSPEGPDRASEGQGWKEGQRPGSSSALWFGDDEGVGRPYSSSRPRVPLAARLCRQRISSTWRSSARTLASSWTPEARLPVSRLSRA